LQGGGELGQRRLGEQRLHGQDHTETVFDRVQDLDRRQRIERQAGERPVRVDRGGRNAGGSRHRRRQPGRDRAGIRREAGIRRQIFVCFLAVLHALAFASPEAEARCARRARVRSRPSYDG
jgi:hypothetical protein